MTMTMTMENKKNILFRDYCNYYNHCNYYDYYYYDYYDYSK